jgi:pimeloyl-ACP methyl ester carboxylesterase
MPASEPSQLTSTKSTRKMLYYKIFEKGPDAEWLVFIHGAGGSSVTWKYQIEAFRPYFNLLLLDLRDHGQSKNIAPAYPNYNFDIVCQDILQVIDHLGIKKAHFMSLSLGSVILQRLNYHRPELIDRMIMAGGVFKANIKIRLFVHSARFLNHFLPYRVMYNLFSFIVLPRKNHARARRIFRMQSQKLSPSEYLKWVELHKEFFHLLKNFFNRKLEKASLVIMGDQDHVFFEAAQRFAHHHQKARLIILEKCGHVCNIDQAELFNSQALSFLLKPSKA